MDGGGVSPITVELSWSGPFDLRHPHSFSPPPEPGVYLWTTGQSSFHRVRYVGETEDLRKRFYEHCVATIGGGYKLFEPACLNDGQPTYEPRYEEYFSKYFANIDEQIPLALANLRAYDFFWAILPSDLPSTVRKSIESALIVFLAKNGHVLQNKGVSRLHENARCIAVRLDTSATPELTLPSQLHYGMR